MHVKPPPIPLIKSKNGEKSGRDCVKNKCIRYSTLAKSDLYEFKMTLFNNVNLEELLLFIRNLQTTLEASGTVAAGAKIRYLRTMIHGEALSQLDTFSAESVSNTPEHLNPLFLV